MNNSSEKKKAAGPMVWVLLTGFLLFVVGVIAGAWIYIPEWYGDETLQAGTFGDMFGGVNALFSGLAFALLVVTLYLQMQELSLQREELAETREELKGQREQMEIQNASFSRQAFDSTFFRMLELHNQIVNDMDVDVNGVNKASGRDCFEFFNYAIDEASRKDQVRAASVFSRIYERHESNLGHYFRNLYEIARFVDDSEFENKRTYMNIIRAQLSSLELVILLYHCVVGEGHDDMKPIVEKFSILRFLPQGKVHDANVLKSMKGEAFTEPRESFTE